MSDCRIDTMNEIMDKINKYVFSNVYEIIEDVVANFSDLFFVTLNNHDESKIRIYFSRDDYKNDVYGIFRVGSDYNCCWIAGIDTKRL